MRITLALEEIARLIGPLAPVLYLLTAGGFVASFLFIDTNYVAWFAWYLVVAGFAILHYLFRRRGELHGTSIAATSPRLMRAYTAGFVPLFMLMAISAAIFLTF